MHTKALLVFSIAIVSFLGCSPTSSSNNTFVNKLTLGTGFTANYMDLVGQGASFTGTPLTLYWRLESKDDMAGSSVIINIKKLTGATSTAFQAQTYPNPQSYGHIMLSTISIASAGSFRATGLVVTGNKTIDSVDFTVQ
ncbi:MAG: hypothetical protein PHC61_13485 [Chitinivibrionales bacterium]|nr:hypothetical protein [Chitinivibrionales bacterium]